jgi:lactoylglutathione lyase
MKGLAFVYDPDGYWVELIKCGEDSGIKNEFNFSQTMLQVKDPKKFGVLPKIGYEGVG